MDTDSFIIHVKTENVYEDIPDDVEKRFNTSNYKVNRQLPTGKNKNVTRLMKGELGGKIMRKFVGVITKTYSYSIDDDSEYKKAKGTKECIIKRKIKFENYENSFETTQLDNKKKCLGKKN